MEPQTVVVDVSTTLVFRTKEGVGNRGCRLGNGSDQVS